MITIKTFVFNILNTNTYIVFDETKECAIIDAACQEYQEKESLVNFIESNKLKPVKLLNTHCHVDHILGNPFVIEKFNISYEAHPAGKLFWEMAKEFGSVFNLKVDRVIKPAKFLYDGEIIKFGNSELLVLYTPGHADGSVCFLNKEQKFVITGDTLFRESIGRTDLPTANYDLLIKSIKNKLLILDDEYIVYPGHGPATTIGYEKMNNAFLK